MIETRSALKIMYFISAADGHIDDIEIEEYKKIATTVAANFSTEDVEKIIAECNNVIPKTCEDDYLDIIQESIDKELSNQSDKEGLFTRALVWNLLAISVSDGEYSNEERKVIKHICRIQNLDNSILMEFEQLIKTINALQLEHTVIEKSIRPYVEIKPIIEDIEHKQQMIINNVNNLIADEELIDFTEKIEHKKDIFDKAGDKISEVTKPVMDKVGASTKPVIDKVVEKTAPMAGKATEGAQKAGKMVSNTFSSLLQKAKNMKGKEEE